MTGTRDIRILIADDHPVVRAGLVALLSGEPGLHVVGEAPTARDAVDFCRTNAVDLVLMDLQFGGGGVTAPESDVTLQGVGATLLLGELEPPPRVLILTNYDTDADILGAIEAGAAGYLLKDAPPAELISGIRLAAAGYTALAPAVSLRLDRRREARGHELSAREVDVLTQVAAGCSNRLIAQNLFLSEATVKSHLVHIFAKLGVTSRTEAVATARERGALR